MDQITSASSFHKTSYSAVGFHMEESSYGMTESELDRICGLLSRAKNTENLNSKWEFVSKTFSACISISIFSFGLIITRIFDPSFAIPNWLYFLLWVITVVCAIMTIITGLIDKKRTAEWVANHKSYIQEVMDIIEKKKEKIDEFKRSTKTEKT